MAFGRANHLESPASTAQRPQEQPEPSQKMPAKSPTFENAGETRSRPSPTPPPPAAEAKERRAEALDALDAVLPFDRRDFLAAILTDDDVGTLRHLAREGIGENSLRALASDLGYLEAWSLASTGHPLLSLGT
jgi:hypothetical protein